MAAEGWPRAAFAYIAGGSADERSLCHPRWTLDEFVLRRRMIMEAIDCQTSTTVLSQSVASPDPERAVRRPQRGSSQRQKGARESFALAMHGAPSITATPDSFFRARGAPARWLGHAGRVLQEIGRDAEVYVADGLRRSIDVITALALGAWAQCIGRPVIYGLADAGADRLQKALPSLQMELVTGVALHGYPDPGSIDRSLATVGSPLARPMGKQS